MFPTKSNNLQVLPLSYYVCSSINVISLTQFSSGLFHLILQYKFLLKFWWLFNIRIILRKSRILVYLFLLCDLLHIKVLSCPCKVNRNIKEKEQLCLIIVMDFPFWINLWISFSVFFVIHILHVFMFLMICKFDGTSLLSCTALSSNRPMMVLSPL